MSNKTILQGHNTALESLKDIIGIPIIIGLDIDISKLNCTNYEMGSFTLSADINTVSYLVNHSLGVIPKYYILWAERDKGQNTQNVKASVGMVATAVPYSAGMCMNMQGYISGYGNNSPNEDNTTTQCNIYAGGYLVGGLTYNYLLLG